MMFVQTKPFVFLFCAGALSLSPGAIGRADTPAHNSARREIAAVYAKMARGLMNKDLSPIAAAEAPDYQDFSPTLGTANRKQDLAQMSQMLATIKSISKAKTEILSLTWRGADAIVMSQNTSVITALQGRKIARVETVNLSRDYWSRTARGWQMRQSVSRAVKRWVNGQRVQ